MSLSQHNPSNGKTVLRHWIRLPSNCSESSSLAVVKIFLEKGDPQLRILVINRKNRGHGIGRSWNSWRSILRFTISKSFWIFCFGPIIKTPLKPKTGLVVEWSTSAELENVIQNPTEYVFHSRSFSVCGSYHPKSGKPSATSSTIVSISVDAASSCKRKKDSERHLTLCGSCWRLFIDLIH